MWLQVEGSQGCGAECFSGLEDKEVCLLEVQNLALAIHGQAKTYLPEYKNTAFGCVMSGVYNTTTGDKLPDFMCPPK